MGTIQKTTIEYAEKRFDTISAIINLPKVIRTVITFNSPLKTSSGETKEVCVSTAIEYTKGLFGAHIEATNTLVFPASNAKITEQREIPHLHETEKTLLAGIHTHQELCQEIIKEW